MAYGQTSSGKTYSLFGENDSPGIIPRFLNDIFGKLKEFESCEESRFVLKYSFFEIYKEKILDSLDELGGQNLNIRENGRQGIYIENLTKKATSDLEAIKEDLELANNRRHINETFMNGRSSRSHFVLTFDIEINYMIDYEDAGERDNNKPDTIEKQMMKSNFYEVTKKSKIIFIDLAGSEKQTYNKLEVLEEGCHINKSLSILNHVIMNLSKQKSKDYIHYRDSKLTHFLKDIFKGSSHFSIIGTILPHHQHLNETLNTLNFVSLAKSVKTNPQINFETKNNTEIMQNQIKALLTKISRLESSSKEELNPESFQDPINQLCKQIKEFTTVLERDRRLSLSKFSGKIKSFLLYVEQYHPDINTLEEFKERIYDISFKINEKRVKVEADMNKEFKELLRRFEKTLEQTNKELFKLKPGANETQKYLLHEKLREKQDSRVFLKKGFGKQSSVFKNRNIQSVLDCPIDELKMESYFSQTDGPLSSRKKSSDNPFKKKKANKDTTNTGKRGNNDQLKSFSKELGRHLSESTSTVRSLDLKKPSYTEKLKQLKKSKFTQNHPLNGLEESASYQIENSSIFKKQISPLTHFYEKKANHMNIFKKVSHREDSLALIKEKTLLKQEREDLEELRQALLKKEDELEEQTKSLQEEKDKEISRLKEEIKRMNYKNSNSMKSTKEDMDEPPLSDDRVKQFNKKVQNLERQLRNRNKDYLFALKELEKIKQDHKTETRLQINPIMQKR